MKTERVKTCIIKFRTRFSEDESRRALILLGIQITLLFLLSATAVIVAIVNNSDRRVLYLALVLSLLALIVTALMFSLTGKYKVSAWLTTISVQLGPWVAILLDNSIKEGDFVPLIYITLSILLCSILLSEKATLLIAVVQLFSLAALVLSSPHLMVFNWVSLIVFVVFIATLGIVSSFIIRKQMEQLSRNIEQRKKTEKEILYISYHDQLTGLYNRRFYEEELKRLDTKRNYPLTIVMGDVNGLKLINDSFGHAMGDELLMKAAVVIKNGCRADDIIARLGGDEFVALLPKTNGEDAELIISRINDLSRREMVGNIYISISFGYATKSNEEENIQETFKNAEDLMYRNKRSESAGVRGKTIDLVLNTLYKKNNREQLHSIKVSEICEVIATKMDFNEKDVHQIKLAGLMHDIGKIEIDETILNKPEKLNKEEWGRMQRHSEIGYRILSSVNEFSGIADDILEHHERWDGKGYPRGLKGEEILLHARIIAIADAFESMTSDKIYSKAISEEEAINEIRRCSGTQFEPLIARVFVEQVLGKEWEQHNKI